MRTVRVNKQLFHEKPAACGRLEKEMAVYDLLDKLQISYSGIDHDAAATADDCIEIESLLGIEVYKNLFLRNESRTAFYLLVMPSIKRFVTKHVSKQIGSSRLSFGEPEYLERFLNITPGSVSILGLMYDREHRVRLLMDREIYESAYFGCHPCINTTSLKMNTSDILHKFLPHTGHQPTVVDL